MRATVDANPFNMLCADVEKDTQMTYLKRISAANFKRYLIYPEGKAAIISLGVITNNLYN